MKSLKIALPLLLLALFPLQQANATIISQGCYDDYRPGTYYPPELLGTICETSATYTLVGTAAISSTTSFNITGTMSLYTSVTTDTSGYSTGYSNSSLTFDVPGLGTYSMNGFGGMNGAGTVTGTVSLTGSSFTTDSKNYWEIWADGVNATAQAQLNLYSNGAKFAVANVYLSAVPVPAAFWLFGTGLIGLVGVAKRKHRV